MITVGKIADRIGFDNGDLIYLGNKSGISQSELDEQKGVFFDTNNINRFAIIKDSDNNIKETISESFINNAKFYTCKNTAGDGLCFRCVTNCDTHCHSCDTCHGCNNCNSCDGGCNGCDGCVDCNGCLTCNRCANCTSCVGCHICQSCHGYGCGRCTTCDTCTTNCTGSCTSGVNNSSCGNCNGCVNDSYSPDVCSSCLTCNGCDGVTTYCDDCHSSAGCFENCFYYY